MPRTVRPIRVSAENLPLARLYWLERHHPLRIAFTQPFGAARGGVVRDYDWGEVLLESRRIATYLTNLGHPPGSRIAILSKNCVHWLIADFAIWMAGHVSVPLYPTLTAATVR
ncbi:MAG TPA: AMP-binding protein, partial [Ramlibacter sp.]|nr:AMP-binding protein [Ramlibacter sp.]